MAYTYRKWIHCFLYSIFIVTTILITGCGGDKANSNNPPPVKPPSILLPVISYMYPIKQMIPETEVRGRLYEFRLVGNYFTGESVALIDGQQAAENWIISDNLITFKNYVPEATAPGVHTVQVRTNRDFSNTVTYEIYHPARSPQLFDAVEKFYLADHYIKRIDVGDFDDDGIGEIFAYDENPYPNEFHIFKRTEAGELKLVKTFNLHYIFEHALTGDINGDGFCDVVIMRSFNWEGGLLVLTNDGQGNLNVTSTQQDILSPEKFLLEDVNGDGRKDLLAYYRDSSGITLSTNTGGSFSSPVRITNRSYVNRSNQYSIPWSLATGDFNGDGKKDILCSAYDQDISTPEFRLLIQQNNGLFQEIPANLEGLPVPNDNITEIATTIDYNRDGYADIALQINDQTEGIRLNIYRNQGDATFAMVSSRLIAQPPNPSAYRFTVGDFDHDGNPDMAGIKDIGTWSENAGDHVIYFWGNGKGEFLSEKAHISIVTSMAAGDTNGDGTEDIVTGHFRTAVSAIMGSKTRTIPRPSYLEHNNAGQLSAADVNGDGYLDLMVSDDAHIDPGMIYINDGQGHFAQGITVPSTAFIIGDLDGDHRAELIGGDASNLWVWPGTGDPSYPSAPVKSPSPGPLDQLELLDINQDGRLDIFSKNEKATSLFFYALGNFTFKRGDGQAPPNDPYAFADFNGDGKLDFLSEDRLYLGEGNGKFAYAHSLVPGLEDVYHNSRYTTGDFNNDGRIDLFSGSIFYGLGNASFFKQGLLSGGSYLAVAGDFNRDGYTDVVSATSEGYAVIFTNDGKGGFLRSLIATGTAVNHIIQADFNNDSKPDLAFSGDNAAIVVLNNYAGSNATAAFQGLNAGTAMSMPGGSIRQTLKSPGSVRTTRNKGQALAAIQQPAIKNKQPVQQKKLQTAASMQESLLVYSPRVGNTAASIPAAIELADMISRAGTLKASPVKFPLLMKASRQHQEGEAGLWNLAREFQDYIKQHPINRNYALYADYDVNAKDYRHSYIRFILCNRRGELVAAEIQNAGIADFQTIKPTSIASCNALLVKRLSKYLR